MERDPRQHDSRQHGDSQTGLERQAGRTAVYALSGLRDKQLALFAPARAAWK
jgi:hypothetical protein